MDSRRNRHAERYSCIKSKYLNPRGGGIVSRIPVIAYVRRLYRLMIFQEEEEKTYDMVISHLSRLPDSSDRGTLDLITSVAFLLDIPEPHLPQEIRGVIDKRKYSRKPLYSSAPKGEEWGVMKDVVTFEEFVGRAEVVRILLDGRFLGYGCGRIHRRIPSFSSYKRIRPLLPGERAKYSTLSLPGQVLQLLHGQPQAHHHPSRTTTNKSSR